MAGNDRFSIDFDGAMLPAMLDALSIASATAFACERTVDGTKRVRDRFKAIYESLAAQMGLANGHDIDAYEWFSACQAMTLARTYHWFEHREYHHDVPSLAFVVDGIGFHVFGHARVMRTSREFAVAEDFFLRYAHVEAVRIEDASHRKGLREWRREREEARQLEDVPSPRP